MAPKKQTPLSPSKRNGIGITFYLHLTPDEHSRELQIPDFMHQDSNSDELKFNGTYHGYHLETAVKAVSSLPLIKRLNKLKRFRHSSSSSVSSAQSKRRKGKSLDNLVVQVSAFSGECVWCGTHKTAQWRKGPTGARGLCNRCGIEYAKHVRHDAKTMGIPTFEAEELLIESWKNGTRFQQYRKYEESLHNDSS